MSTTTFNFEPPKFPKRPQKSSGSGAFVPTLVVLFALVLVVMILASFYTEMAWFSQIEAARVFWTQYGAAIGLGAIGFVLVWLAIALNVRIGAGKFPKKAGRGAAAGAAKASAPADGASDGFDPSELFRSKAASDEVKNVLAGKAWIFYGLIPAIVALAFGTRLAPQWQTFLLWFNRTPFGTTDPEYGFDVSFYVFTLPVLHAVVGFLMVLLVFSLLAAVVGHWLSGGIDPVGSKLKISKRAQIHFAVLAGLIVAMVAVNFWLSRYDLLLGNNQRFSGASFTDINASKPGITILAVSALLLAVLFVVAGVMRKWKLAVTGVASLVVVGLVLTGLYPFLVQRFKVDPNAAELESTYIQRNIDATLTAYGLDDVEVQPYAARTTAQAGQLRADSETAAQIRLLDPNIVGPSFNQLQQNRQYYQFQEPLQVDRYTIGGELRDTVIGVRELNLAGLSNERRSWVNDHTVYTHGFGVATAYGNTMTAKGDPSFWEAGIPSSGELGDYEPRVYFGQNSPDYSVVGAPEGTEPWELDYPDDTAANGQVNTTYQGDGGPAIGNVFQKLMYAIKFRSTELFFSDRVTADSQILFDRDPHQRLQKVAPYLTLDSKAVPAVVDMDDNPDTPKQLVWIVDGYTTSNNYPYSARETLQAATSDAINSTGLVAGMQEVNYIRNSVKAVVNAYDGSVTLYQWDQEDPIVNAWSKIFPGQITPLAQMPGDLIAHVRYPEDLFKIQRSLLSRYHVTDAKSFYSGGDFWQVPREPTSTTNAAASAAADDPTAGLVPVEGAPAQPPYYLTLQMPGQDSASFSLTTSYIPGGNTNRNVMTGFLAADSNAGNTTGQIADSYGKLRLLEAPRDLTVSGPGQAENTMLAAPAVSTALNLLRQGGTQVEEGNLLSLPIGGGLLYVQPIYVQASQGTQYPTLQYVLALFGDQVGFAPTLDEALNQVFGGDSGVNAGDANIAGTKEAPVDSGTAGTAGGTGTAGTAGGSDAGTADADAGSDAGAAAGGATAGAGAAATGTPAEQLNAALQDARTALTDSEKARQDGDWAAYGDAQKRLADAIERASQAQTNSAGN